jgi:hypothetical protein
MPSDDVILDLKQIAGFPLSGSAIQGDKVVLQRGGLGGPYVSIDPINLIGTALATPGDNMAIGGQLQVQSVEAGSLQVSNAAVGLLNAQKAFALNLTVTWGSFNTLTAANAAIASLTVSGDMQLGGTANLANAVVQNTLSVGGPATFGALTTQNLLVCNVGTFETGLIVNGNLAIAGTGTVNGYPIVTTGNVGGLAPIESPAFTGTPTAPTPATTDNSTAIATTAFVVAEVANVVAGYAPLASPAFSGIPTAPTQPLGTSTGAVATTAFVMAAVAASTAGVASFNGRTGIVDLELTDVTAVGGAPLVSPVFTGSPTAPTPATGNNSQLLATTAFVANTVSAIDAGVTTFNNRAGAVVLQTADITGAGGALASDAGVSSFNGRTGDIVLTANDVSAAGGVAANSPALTGVPTAPTATPASLSTNQLATTAFVQAAIAAGAAVSSFNTRTGAITLTTADVSGAGGLTGFVITTQSFTATGAATYTPPANLVYAVVEVIGGGASGGPVAGAANVYGGAGGGGSGAYARSTLSAAQIGASQPVTVGAGGTATPTAGANGATSSFGSLVSAGGGASGTAGPIGVPGQGSQTGVGQLVRAGGAGGPGWTGVGNGAAYGGFGGSVWGGYVAGSVATANTGVTPAAARANSGAGGSGAATNNFAQNNAGGNGAAGIVFVTEFSRS